MTDNHEPEPAEIIRRVAEAVRLQEGEAGVRSVFLAFHRHGPASTRSISRRVGLPVPLVAAVASELRQHGWLTTDRPSGVTPLGVTVARTLGTTGAFDPTCETCAGLEIPIPKALADTLPRLQRIMADGPGADLTLDQSHCTPETKLRRILALIRAGVLPGSLLLVGDDDLVSLSIGVVAEAMGIRLVERLVVVDIADDVLGYIDQVSGAEGLEIETLRHDLREPLPTEFRETFDVAMTDPPYTPEGARLFLSRAIEGLRPGPARSVFLSFGPKGPDEALEVQRAIMELGLVPHRMTPNFNEYVGSGILAGTGVLQQLLTTSGTAPVTEDVYRGPLYTRDKRSRQREYECAACSARHAVGPGAAWASVAELRAAGCPNCGGGPFRPGQLLEPTPETES